MTESPRTARDGAVTGSGRDLPSPTSRDGSSPGGTTRDQPTHAEKPLDSTVLTAWDSEADRPYLRVNLPTALKDDYRPVRDLPTAGAEADLLLVEALDGSGSWVVKLYRPGIELDGDLLETITKAEIAHVVGMRKHGTSDGMWHEVLGYVSQGSLAELMRAAGGPLGSALVRDVLVQLHGALTELHQRGVVHRDVKPDNVLVRTRSSLHLLLADFGLATAVERSWRLASASRTLAYAAPEAAHGHVSPARDWWGLGMVVLEALTGEQPLVGLDDAVVSIHLATRAIDVGGVEDRRWRQLCRGLLTRDPMHRWGAGDVLRWLEGEDPAVVQDSDVRIEDGAAPYVFEGEPYETPAHLAAAMATSWKAAARQLVVPGHAYQALTTWVLQRTSSGDVAARLDELSNISSPDKRVVALIYALAPNLPPVFREHSLAGEGLRDLARASRGALDGAEAEAVHLLASEQVLALYPGLAGVAQRWAALLDQVHQRISSAQAAGAGGPLGLQAERSLSAFTLQLVVDPGAGRLLATLASQVPRDARKRAWFVALDGTSDADRLVRVLLAPIAEGQQRDEDRRAEQREEQERERILAAAQQQRWRRIADARGQVRRSAQSTKWLLPSLVAGTVATIRLPGWIAGGSPAVVSVDKAFSESGVTGLSAQVATHASGIHTYGLLLGAAAVAALGWLIGARRVPGPTTLRGLRTVNIVGVAALPVLWPVGLMRAIGTAKSAGPPSHRDRRLRRWALLGTLAMALLAALRVLLRQNQPRRPFALEAPLIEAGPASVVGPYLEHWPQQLTMTHFVNVAPLALIVGLLAAALVTYSLVLRSYQARSVVERRALQASLAIGACCWTLLLPYALAAALGVLVGVVVFLLALFAILLFTSS